MKSVLPKLQKFGEEDVESGDTSGGAPQSSRLRRNRPLTRAGLRRPGEQIEVVGSASKINITCTNSVKEKGSRSSIRVETDNPKKGAQIAAYEELRLLQSQWEAQHRSNPNDIGQFTLRGQGRTEVPLPENNKLTVLSLEDVPTDISGLDLKGASEWMAVPWELPDSEVTSNKLACLLLCKGVAKSQLPRVNIADWKPGSLGIPTFHCMRCFQRWMRNGRILETCSEEEVTTEGPAMCITLQTGNITEKEMLVGGILGEDGKPVKIRVEGPKAIKKLLKKERRRKLQRKRAKVGKEEMAQGHLEMQDALTPEAHQSQLVHTDFEDSLSSHSSDEDLLDLSDILKGHILQQNETKNRDKIRATRDANKAKRLRRADTLEREHTNLSDSSSDSVDMSWKSDDSLSIEPNCNSSKSLTDRNRRLRDHTNVLTRSKERKCDKKRNVEPNQANFRSKSYTNEMCTSSSSGENQLSVLSLGSKTVHQKTKSAMSHVPKRSARSSSSGPSTAERAGSLATAQRSKTKTISQKDESCNNLGATSSTSLISRLFSRSSEHSVSPTAKSAPPTAVCSNRGSTSSIIGSASKKQKENVKTSNENVHLPSLVDNTVISQSVVGYQENPLPPINHPTNKEHRFRTTKTPEHSSVSIHLPKLNEHRTSLVQQEMSEDLNTTGEDKSSGLNEVTDKKVSQKDIDTHEDNKESSIGNNTQENTVTAPQSLKTTIVTKNDPHFEEMTQSQSKHKTEVPHSSSKTTDNNIHPSQSTTTKKHTAKVSNAVVKQEFEFHQMGTDSRTNQTRIRRKSRWADETPLVAASASSHISSSFTQMPTKKSTASHTNIQRLPSFQDDIPRRFGQKIVKKSKKVDADSMQSANYNSKDLGNIIGNSGANGEYDGRSSRRNSLAQIERGESSRQSLAARILRRAQQHQENNNIPMPIMGRGNSSNQNSRPSSESSGLGPRSPNNIKPVSNLLKDSMNTPQALVRLKPLEQDNHIVKDDHEVVVVPPPDVEVAELLLPADQVACDPDAQVEERESEDSGLEDISEESEEEEDDEFDFEIPRPIPELKEITPMSFTSSYAYSFYKMGGPYREVYNKTHARSLQPLRIGRRKRKPPKVRRKKVK